jgi:hypothetical protein
VKPDVCLHTPLLLTIKDDPWQLLTPSNTLEFGSQSKSVLQRIERHVDSSRTLMVEAIESLSKGTEIMIHQGVLMCPQLDELQEANEAAMKRKSHKRKRVQNEGTLRVEDSVRLTALKESGAHGDAKKVKKRVCIEVGEPWQRRCGCCGKTGYKARTCKKDAEIAIN